MTCLCRVVPVVCSIFALCILGFKTSLLMPNCYPIGLVNLQNFFKQIACCLFDQSQEFVISIFIDLNN